MSRTAYTFCPKCGSLLTVRRVDNKERQACSHCDFILYENSRPCVGVLTLDENRLLLVQRAIEPFKGYWDIPGGFLEAGEHPATGAVREVREETGLLIEPTELLGIFMDVYGPAREPTLNICYIAKPVGGQPQTGSDAAKMHWFSIDALPDDVAFEWANEALDLLKRRLDNPVSWNGQNRPDSCED